MASSAQIGMIWLRVRLVLPLKKMRIRTNPGQVGSPQGRGQEFRTPVGGTLTDPQKALLRSQGGPLASAPFISMPIDKVSRIDSQSFRLLFLLRQPLPLTVRSCLCGRLLDSHGHHRSACPVAVVLGRRGFTSGERGSTNLPRSRRKGQNECVRSRSPFASVQQVG